MRASVCVCVCAVWRCTRANILCRIFVNTIVSAFACHIPCVACEENLWNVMLVGRRSRNSNSKRIYIYRHTHTISITEHEKLTLFQTYVNLTQLENRFRPFSLCVYCAVQYCTKTDPSLYINERLYVCVCVCMVETRVLSSLLSLFSSICK